MSAQANPNSRVIEFAYYDRENIQHVYNTAEVRLLRSKWRQLWAFHYHSTLFSFTFNSNNFPIFLDTVSLKFYRIREYDVGSLTE